MPIYHFSARLWRASEQARAGDGAGARARARAASQPFKTAKILQNENQSKMIQTKNQTIIKQFAKNGKPIILSTGLSDLREVKDTVEFLQSQNSNYKNKEYLALLQCTSTYPTIDNEVNLKVIDTLVIQKDADIADEVKSIFDAVKDLFNKKVNKITYPNFKAVHDT